jgi:AraC-like DNA-binding protein
VDTGGRGAVLYDLAMSPEWVRAWKPVVPGVREVSRARGAGGDPVTILLPHVVHDGRAGVRGGFRKRVLYLGTEVLDQRLTGRAVDDPDIHEPALRRAVHALHRALGGPDDALEAEAWLATVGERLRAHLGDPPRELPSRHPAKLAGDLRDLRDLRLFERTTLGEAGSALGASPSHLVRSFTQTFGIAPHRYVVARRIDAARKRLLEGEPIALVAAGVGFYDQAHFTRQFKRHVGTPPGRYVSPTGWPRRRWR